MDLTLNNLYPVEMVLGFDPCKIDLYKTNFLVRAFTCINAFDIQKLALFVNSGFFELNYLRYCKSINSSNKLLQFLLYDNFQCYFHRLLDIPQEEMDRLDNQNDKIIKSLYPCVTCKHLNEENFTLGIVHKCNNQAFEPYRKRSMHIDTIKTCDNKEQVDTLQIEPIIPKTIEYININENINNFFDINYIHRSKKGRIEDIKKAMLIQKIVENCPKDFEVNVSKTTQWVNKNYDTNRDIPNYLYKDPEKERTYRRNRKFVKKLGG